MSVDYNALAAMYDSAGALEAKKIAQQYKLGKEEISARLKIAAQSSKDTRYGIDAERETARERIEQARQEMERIGIPDMEIRRFVAETTAELAKQELALKREIFLVESGLARDQLAKDVREMEEIGIPRVQIERYVAEQQAQMAQLEYAEGQRQFNTTTSGWMQQPGTLPPHEQARMQQLLAHDAALKAAGPAGTPGLQGAELQELQGYQQTLATGGGQQRTLEGLELDRRYGLDVAQFGAQLASTPDTYFQARRFQGVDVPRLMGGAAAPTNAPTGGPTPGVATMGSYLGGQDPYATPYGGPQAGAGQPAAPGTLGMPGTPEDDRAKQIAKIASVSPPSPYDGLDEQDTNTLRLMESVYKKGGGQIAGGEYERLAASGRLGYLQSAGRLLGYDPKELESTYQSYRPTQGSASAAG